MAKRTHIDKSDERLREEFLASIPDRVQALKQRLAKEPDEAEASVQRLLEAWCDESNPRDPKAHPQSAVVTPATGGVVPVQEPTTPEEAPDTFLWGPSTVPIAPMGAERIETSRASKERVWDAIAGKTEEPPKPSGPELKYLPWTVRASRNVRGLVSPFRRRK
jgi:hypothetical protein